MHLHTGRVQQPRQGCSGPAARAAANAPPRRPARCCWRVRSSTVYTSADFAEGGAVFQPPLIDISAVLQGQEPDGPLIEQVRVRPP
jgi:hypothetical protein